MAIKLSGLKAKTTAVAIDVIHPLTEDVLYDEDGKTKVQAFLVGSASAEYRDFEKKKAQKQLDRLADGKRAKNILTVDSLYKDSLDKAVICTKKITVLTTDEGKPLDNPDSIREVLADVQNEWLLNFLLLEIDKNSNFF